MSEDAEFVAPDERVLRRIPKAPGFYDSDKTPPIQRGAFTPNRNDTDGLSCFLERLMSIERLIELAAPKPASELVIVRFLARDIYDIGLTLRRTFDPGDPPGHVIIPELNKAAYDIRKSDLRPLMVQLMLMAEKSIVFNGGRLDA